MKITDTEMKITGLPKTWADVAHTFVSGILNLALWAIVIGGCCYCCGARP